MAPIDRFLDDYGVPSARYVDDIYVFVESVDAADQLLCDGAAMGGSGFIACFVGGLLLTGLREGHKKEPLRGAEPWARRWCC